MMDPEIFTQPPVELDMHGWGYLRTRDQDGATVGGWVWFGSDAPTEPMPTHVPAGPFGFWTDDD